MRKALVFLFLAVALFGGMFWILSRLAGTHDAPAAASARAIAPSSAPHDDVEKAWDRVHDAPSDPNAWAELGNAEQAENDLVAAEHAYRTAILMGGDNGDAYARLGFLLYAADDDRALSYLLEAKRRHSRLPLLDFTIDTLRTRGVDAAAAVASAQVTRVTQAEKPPDAGPPVAGPASTPTPSERAVAAAEVTRTEPSAAVGADCSVPVTRVEGRNTLAVSLAIQAHPARLVIDTGAGITVVNRAFADSARLPVDRSTSINAITANGRVAMATAVVDEIVLGDRRAKNVRVAVCDNCIDSGDGLLGLDLVAAFGLRLDLANLAVSFADCDRTPR